MKNWLFILLFLPFIAHSQIAITGLNRFVVTGTSGGGGTGIAIDTSYELRADSGIINVRYNPLRPNIQETVPGTNNLSLFMNYVPDGYSGNVRFIYTIPPIVNGILTTPFAAGPATVNKTYTKAIGVTITWN
jgi:hypothetical protein